LAALLEVVPLLDEAAAREEALEIGHIFGLHFGGEQLEVGGGGSGLTPSMRRRMKILFSSSRPLVSALAGGPGGIEVLHPAFGFEGAEGAEGVFLVGDLLELVAAGVGGNLLDEAFGFGVLIAGFGALIHLPAGAGGEADGADHAGGVFDKAVVAGEAEVASLDVGETVEGSRSRPQEPSLREMAMALAVKSRRRRSSRMGAQW
jgi:hypothetical protein